MGDCERVCVMLLCAVLSGLVPGGLDACVAESPYAWQQDYARMTETGDIEWTPRAFRFATDGRARYIDFETGSDANDGACRKKPWKHHPWDTGAVGNAAAARGITTCIFKGGVIYRGQLVAKDQGQPGAPIRLTRDPGWGRGSATLAGSELVSGWRKGTEHPRIPEPREVWQASLDFTPRALWMVDAQGKATRIPLARHPNWSSQRQDHKAQWFQWTNDPHPFQSKDGFSANDSRNLKGHDEDYVLGALIYSEFGWVMGTPYPCKVSRYDPNDGSVKFEKWTGGGNASVVFRGMRYYLEDKPQYLDDPAGEFWFDKQGEGGMLYVRLPGAIDPNTVRMEAGKRSCLIVGDDVRHLVVNGLDFRWTTQPWALDVASWDFSTKPWGTKAAATPACIRIFGKAVDVQILNCTFEDVVMGIRMQAVGRGSPIQDITVADSIFRNTDVGAAYFDDGAGWGFARLMGVLDGVCLYRNSATNVGFRATRYERGCAFSLTGVRRAHIAGNVIVRSGAQAINVVGGKSGGIRGEVPLVRVLVHQNKAWQTMQNANDFGGIESWQHGPVYMFNNLSFDARGQWEGRRQVQKQSPGFGHAYYLDGGFKNFLFNNIAWGLSNDPASPLVNCSAFQEIHSYQNSFFNNTVYNYTVGSRRQSPHAGRNLYLGNVWQGISERVFRHADPAKTLAEGNARDAGPQKEHFDYASNAYAANVFHDVARLGVFESSGRWLETVDDFRAALKQRKSLVSELGVMDTTVPLRDPAHGDFRLNQGSSAVDNGTVSFVPWALFRVVAEWNFYPAGDDHTRILDSHWAARDYLAERTDYHKRPTYPLTAVNVAPENYVRGPLENFTAGALQLTPARKSYAVLRNAVLDQPYTVNLATRARHGQDPLVRPVTFEGDALATAEIYQSNFLVEVVLKAHGDGLIIGKQQGTGYALRLCNGLAVFSLKGPGGATAELTSHSRIDTGRWLHVIAEADRETQTLTLYVNGERDADGPGLGVVSLANDGDLYVGGTPAGEWLDGCLEFMRVAQGTLADAHTTAGELYAWEFDGPAHRDRCGVKPKGRGRDAGALESF